MNLKYKLQNSPDNVPVAVTIIGQAITIPFDPANTDYQAFLKYQAEGGKVYGADEEVPDGQIEQGNTPLPADEEQK